MVYHFLAVKKPHKHWGLVLFFCYLFGDQPEKYHAYHQEPKHPNSPVVLLVHATLWDPCPSTSGT
jgi:hypothetical protein